jgi:uroporphyrinogen III methyltransferase/synthase
MLATDDGSRAEWRTVIYAEREAEAEAADLSRELLAMVQATTMHPGGGDGPLQGRSVLITRPKRGAGDLARLIEAAGGTALLAPSIRIDAVPFDGEAMARRIGTNTWDWIAFTSRNAVEGFLDGIGQVVAPAAVLQVVKIGAVGEATARSLRDRGIDVDIVSTGQTGADLGRAIAQHGVSGQCVLLPGGNLNRQDLADCLRDHGGEVETAQVYATTSEHRLPETLSGQLQRAEIDAVTFTSPSSAREFVRLLDEAAYRLAGVVIGCLGETTAAEARRLGLDWCVTAERPTLESLVERVAAALQARYVERDQGVPA